MKKLFLMFSITIPAFLFGGGFQLQTTGVKSMSLGGLNTGFCKDASVVYFNPGAMGTLENKFNLTAGVCFTMPSTSFLSNYNSNVDMENQNSFPYHLYASYNLSKKLALGVSINKPFGFHTKWNSDWEGRYLTQESSLNTTFVQPSLSFNINKKISIGAGFIYATGDYEKQFAFKNVGSEDINANYKGNSTSYGFNIGAYFKLSENATFGLDYRSKMKMEFNNCDASYTGIPGSLINNPYPASAKFNSSLILPSSFNAGLTYEIDNKALVGIELNYSGWSSFDSLNFLFPDNPELDSHNETNYKDVISVRLGAQYKATEKFPVRIGFAYDQSPVQDGYVSPALPDADKTIYSVGASYLFSKKFSIDFAYSFEAYKERLANYEAVNFSGSYKTRVSNFALALNLSF